jgi:hypothetical protein
VIKASDTNGPSADEETNELVNTLRSKYSSLKMNIISEEKKARQLFALLLSKSAKDAQHSRDVDMMKQIEDAAKDVDTVEQSKHISIAAANDSVESHNEVQLINVDDGNKQCETTIVSDVVKDVVNDVINAMVDTGEKTLEANDSTEQHVVDKISIDDKQ